MMTAFSPPRTDQGWAEPTPSGVGRGGQAPQLWLLALRGGKGGVEAEYERRFGATGGGVYVVKAAPGGEGQVDETQLEPPYAN